MSEDAVNHPKHYVNHPSGVECITITEAFNFNLGNAIKYIWRAGLKGDAKQDLEKARWYVDREIQRMEPSPEAMMGPWEHVGHVSDDGVDKLKDSGGTFYTPSLRPYLDKLKDSAKGGFVGEKGPELMPLKVSYSVPVDDETPDSGLVDYVRKLAKAAMEQEDERLNKALAKALWEYPMKDVCIFQWADDDRSRVVEVRDGDEWRVFEG